MAKLWLLPLLLLVPLLAFAWKRPQPASKKQPAAEVPLSLVAAQVVRTLDTFNLGADSQDLPKLSKVVFDFNATSNKDAGISFNLLIFRAGVNRETDTSNEVTFSYTVPAPAVTPGAAHPKAQIASHDFSQVLLATLETAATQVRQTQSIAGAKFTNLTITLSYGVVWDTSGGGDGTISLVTLDGSVDRKRSDVQTLTLTFGQ